MKQTAEDTRLLRVTAICLSLPEAARTLHAEHADFRVRKKVFAYFRKNHHGDGIVSICCKSELGENNDCIPSDPERYYRLPVSARGVGSV